MNSNWAVVGCGYMAREYCKVLVSKGIQPAIYSRNLGSPNVDGFRTLFPQLEVVEFGNAPGASRNWIVCTNIESHEDVCSQLRGQIWCEKPFSHRPTYATNANISILMNRRYYYWVEFMMGIVASGEIVKVVASIPERGVDALITQSIHVIDLLWYLLGPFNEASRTGDVCPTFCLTTHRGTPLVINMNYGAHENFSLKFYSKSGLVYEARPLEAFAVAESMEVREPDDELPFRTYRPVTRALAYNATGHKPGLGELVDDLVQGGTTRLPDLSEHRRVHEWMERNML